MKKIISTAFLSGCLFTSMGSGHAALQSLDNNEMQEVRAQGGVDLSLVLRLNQKDGSGNLSSATGYDVLTGNTYANLTADPRQSLDCDNRQFCRFALALNNRESTVDTDPGTDTTVGNKQWLVLKGFQGYVEVPKLSLDGAPVTDIKLSNGTADTSAPDNRVALKISLDKNFPIKIRHLGFEALAIEVGSSASAGGNPYGYLNMSSCAAGDSRCSVETYTNGKYDSNAGFDAGRETGFLGLDLHGNLAVNAKVYVFSCQARGAC